MASTLINADCSMVWINCEGTFDYNNDVLNTLKDWLLMSKLMELKWSFLECVGLGGRLTIHHITL